MKGHSADGPAAPKGVGGGWLRIVLAASVVAAALIVAADPADARSLRRHADKRQAAKKESAPAAKGQLLIAVSIGSQRLTVYDDGVPIAQSPVSTGTRSHPTPTGVFSVIQKSRHHRSNIYSGAPMPFMQRITWSGVALHAGVLPGYPASHGCIRLPSDFAARLWGMTKLGARVVVTRHDVTPIPISHARLAALQVPVMATSADKRADLLRPGIGLDETVPPSRPATMRTADASAGAVASDASAPESTPVNEPAADAAPALPSAPPPAAPASASDEPAPAPNGQEPKAATATDETQSPATAAAAAETDPAPETTSAIDLALPSAVPPAAQPVASAAPAEVVVAPPAADPLMMAALPLDEVFVPPDRPARPLRAGPVSVFISRKESRLYVRKRFDPLFSVPVTIRDERPIGTHVYTAAEGEGASDLRWIAVSLPAEPPAAPKSPPKRGRRAVQEVAAPPSPSTAVEALDRVELPEDVVARIAALLSPGASLIISDQGLGNETGLETDFIVLSR